ncbi:MAG: FtsW/RodA/SpoVE family cell cycle protein [Lachnospiraceae bacterium]|nr:FtsW/RodA/SpoVE family cell cycle protein [Lachnospiraceae bacterium]
MGYSLLICRKKANSPYHLFALYFLGLCSRSFGYLSLYAYSEDVNYLFFAAFAEIILFAGYFLFRLLLPMGNGLLLQDSCLLLGFGLLMLSRLSLQKGTRQLFFALIGYILALALPWLIPRMKRMKGMPYILAFSGIGVLSLVLLEGAVINGSKLNFTVLGFTFQPSEFAKLFFIFFLAGVYIEKPKLPLFILIGCISAVHVLLLVLSRDLGGALIFFVIYSLMTFFYLEKAMILVPLGGICSLAAILAYRIFSHVRVRVQAFLDPWSVIDNEGFQLTQSLFAMCSGGVFGLGLFKGTPQDIPFVDTDFIFSAIAEEMGVLFAILLLLACLHVFLAAMQSCYFAQDPYHRFLLFGFGNAFLFQVFLTVGGGIKFIPLTGVTLPLVSYGGSSLITTLLMFGCLYTLSAGKTSYPEAARLRHMVRGMEVCASVLFLSLGGYAAFFSYKNYKPLISNAYNGRQRALAKENTRGMILSRDGEILAQTVMGEDGKEHREYPYGSLFSHVVGYSTRGRMGIEAYYHYYLITSHLPISKKIELEEAGKKLPADNVITTLDPRLQEIVSKALGVYKGAALVSDPRTGEILAMISKPDFEPEEIPDIWEELLADTEDSRLVNRTTSGLYPPGSTFKIVTSLEYLRENPDSYQNYQYNCNGKIQAEGYQIQCYHGMKHGKVDFFSSFAKSCNASFANIGLSLDRASLGKTLDSLYFGKELPGDLSAKESSCPVSSDTGTYEMLQDSIGQGKVLMTPLHLNLLTQAIANGGSFHAPLLALRAENAEGTVIASWSPDKGHRIMSEEEAAVLGAMMEEVVQEGTGKRLKDLSYTAAGKTGSAEYGAEKGDSHAWFTGYAPAEEPEIAVTIIIEGAGSGGEYAVPIAKRVFDGYFGVE